MSYNDYEKVQDTLLFLGSTFVLKFNVSLATKDRHGNRKFYYSEYKYQSRYSDYGNVVSVKRQIKYYITIEEMANFQNNVMITTGDMPMLKNILTIAAKWLNDNSIFDLNPDKKLMIKQDVSTQMNLGQNSALMFEPVIIPMMDGTSAKGIRMYINDTKNFVDIEARNFMAFYEIIRTIDMYSAACAVLASLPMTHDDAEVNRADFESSAAEQRQDYQKKPGFFDK